MGYRIALGGIFTECNHLGGLPIDIERFEQYELLRGGEVLDMGSGTVGGMLEVLRANDAKPAPIIYASTCAGGPITSECYRQLKSELLDGFQESLPVDGVLLPLHGSSTAEDVGDPEGDLIQAARQIVGEEIPIVVTLDLHAHVTAKMVKFADALIAWETYPHRDSFSTGQRGARMLVDILEGRCRPAMAMAKVPVLTSGIHGGTDGDGGFANLMRQAKSREGRDGVLSTSVFLVHPYLDLPEMGSGCLVITDDDMDKAVSLATEIAEEYWERRFELEAEALTPLDAIAEGLKIEGGPVVLVETADCCGGGAAGDSIVSLAALLEAKPVGTSLVPVVDPEAAAACHAVGVSQTVTVSLGHKLDPRWGKPIEVTGTVERLSDGRFTYSGGVWDGVEAEMGRSAVLEIGSIRVLVTTNATYDWRDEQFQCAGLDPATAKFIVAKNPMNFREAYGALTNTFIVLDTPGPTPATVKHVEFQRLERPFFPADEDIPGMRPVILS